MNFLTIQNKINDVKFDLSQKNITDCEREKLIRKIDSLQNLKSIVISSNKIKWQLKS